LWAIPHLTNNIDTWQHVGISHARLVLGLPDKDQERLIRTAEEKEWTVQKLEHEASKAKKKLHRNRGGRRPLPVFVKSIHHLRRFADNEDMLLGDVAQMRELPTEERAELKRTVTTLQTHLEHLLHELDKADE
jgi:hypothetical protein